MSIQRYICGMHYAQGDDPYDADWPTLFKDNGGECVLYTDHLAELASARDEALEEAAEKCRRVAAACDPDVRMVAELCVECIDRLKSAEKKESSATIRDI